MLSLLGSMVTLPQSDYSTYAPNECSCPRDYTMKPCVAAEDALKGRGVVVVV